MCLLLCVWCGECGVCVCVCGECGVCVVCVCGVGVAVRKQLLSPIPAPSHGNGMARTPGCEIYI